MARSLPERIEKVRSVAWAADSRTLFYVKEDEAKRALGCIAICWAVRTINWFTRKPTRGFRCRWRIRAAGAICSSPPTAPPHPKCGALRADEPQAMPSLVSRTRGPITSTTWTMATGLFYIVTNDKRAQFSPGHRAGRRTRRRLAGRKSSRIAWASCWKAWMFLRGTGRARARRGISAPAGDAAGGLARARESSMPEPACIGIGGGANMEFDTDVFRFHYDSYITPDATLRLSP